MSTAVVVGSGPNGLAAAVRLAQHGIAVEVLEAADHIGGGTRTSELTVPGVLHDHCSAFHPMGVGSPYLQTLGLERYGLRWRWPEIDCAHPLDSGEAGLLWRSIDRTAEGLGTDGARWLGAFGWAAACFDELAEDLMGPMQHVPRHPVRLARFGPPALLPASVTARWWDTDKARALFGGVAAHAFRPLHRPTTSAIGRTIIAAGHRHGWPVAEGGSRSITDALASLLAELGGKIQRRRPRRQSRGHPLGRRGPAGSGPRRHRPHLRRAASGRESPAPIAGTATAPARSRSTWPSTARCRGPTRSAGGRGPCTSAAPSRRSPPPKRDIAKGRMPDRPFVLVGQQYLADPTRSAGNVNPLWTYAHVPHGYTGDATTAILDQIERFAPGFRDRIVACAVRPTAELAVYNPNYVGGDVVTGANTGRQLLLRPRVALDPYSSGIPGVYICSAASPPGAGAHGMCGFHAAGSALRHLRIRPMPAAP